MATGHNWASNDAHQRIKKRYGRDRLLRYFGLGAIVTALMLLAILIASLTYTGYVAFYTTKVSLDIFLDVDGSIAKALLNLRDSSLK